MLRARTGAKVYSGGRFTVIGHCVLLCRNGYVITLFLARRRVFPLGLVPALAELLAGFLDLACCLLGAFLDGLSGLIGLASGFAGGRLFAARAPAQAGCDGEHGE